MSTMVQKSQSADAGAVRSVGRAIVLLQALNRRPESTLHDLHCETGLPKSSIVRLLRTLEAKGLAAQSASYGAYQLLGRAKSLSSGFHHEPQIIEAAEQIMIDFTAREGWPLTLAFFDVDAMVVRVCTIPHTSLWLEQSTLNRRLSMVSHALGRAFLAFSAPNEQRFLLEILKQSEDPADAAAGNSETMAHIIEQVRARGYASCDALSEQRSSTIAVPVRDNGRIVACLGLTWIAAAMSPQKAVEQYVPHIFGVADAISGELARRSMAELPSRHTASMDAE